ncbi:MAG: hypothetical protein ACXVCL_17300, partial [Bdellovibrio sp.]
RGEFMRWKRDYLNLVPTFIVIASLILSACQDGGQKKVRVVPGGPDRSAEIKVRAPLSPDQQKNVKDPVLEQAYKAKLSPIFDKMSPQGTLTWSQLINLKRWIISTEDIKKDVTASVSVTAKDTDYIARQTMYDIFIDDGIYLKRSDDEKADILLNEIVTSLYTLKFFSDDELCQLVKEKEKNAICDAKKPSSEEGTLPQGTLSQVNSSSQAPPSEMNANVANRRNDLPKQPDSPKEKTELGPKDYETIKKVKEHILGHATDLKYEAIISLLKDNGFDMRVFNIKLNSDAKKLENGQTETAQKQNDYKEINKDTVDLLFERAKNWNEKKVTCFLLRSDKKGECSVSSTRSTQANAKTKEQEGFLDFVVKMADKNLISETLYQSQKINIAKYGNGEGDFVTYLIPLSGRALKKDKTAVGAIYHTNYFIVNKAKNSSAEEWNLEGFLSIPGEITEISDNESKTVCKGKQTKNEEVVLAAIDDKNVELIKSMIDSFPAQPPCGN